MKIIKYNTPTLSYVHTVFALALLCFIFSSCDKKEDTTVRYYNIDSLLREQNQYLAHAKTTLNKEVRLGNKHETKLITASDSMLWLTELDAFRQLADINKPINHGAYTVKDKLQEAQSNLTMKSFMGTDKLTVAYLKIYYQGSISKIRKIVGLIKDENPLYRNSRKLTMEFQIINNKPVLTHYSIIGLQKNFLSDPVEFSIKGQIKIN